MALVVRYKLPRELQKNMLREFLRRYDVANGKMFNIYPNFEQFFNGVNRMSADKNFTYDEFSENLKELIKDKEIVKKKKTFLGACRKPETTYVYKLSKK